MELYNSLVEKKSEMTNKILMSVIDKVLTKLNISPEVHNKTTEKYLLKTNIKEVHSEI